MSEITELELQIPSPPHVDEDDTVFVALGKDVKKDEKVLTWALHYSRGRKICVLHIHQPARMIPMSQYHFCWAIFSFSLLFVFIECWVYLERLTSVKGYIQHIGFGGYDLLRWNLSSSDMVRGTIKLQGII